MTHEQWNFFRVTTESMLTRESHSPVSSILKMTPRIIHTMKTYFRTNLARHFDFRTESVRKFSNAFSGVGDMMFNVDFYDMENSSRAARLVRVT